MIIFMVKWNLVENSGSKIFPENSPHDQYRCCKQQLTSRHVHIHTYVMSASYRDSQPTQKKIFCLHIFVIFISCCWMSSKKMVAVDLHFFSPLFSIYTQFLLKVKVEMKSCFLFVLPCLLVVVPAPLHTRSDRCKVKLMFSKKKKNKKKENKFPGNIFCRY